MLRRCNTARRRPSQTGIAALTMTTRLPLGQSRWGKDQGRRGVAPGPCASWRMCLPGACYCNVYIVEERRFWSKTPSVGTRGVCHTGERCEDRAVEDDRVELRDGPVAVRQPGCDRIGEATPVGSSPSLFNRCNSGQSHAGGNLLPGLGDALDRQLLKPMVPFLCGWVTHDAAAMRRNRNGH